MSKMMNKTERAENCVLSLQFALYHAVHDYPGGVGAIAGANGLSANTLQNKLNPGVESHKLNINDFELISLMTQDERILQTVCAFFGAGYFKFPDVSMAQNETLLQKGAELTKEVSELMQRVSKSLEDGTVNQSEVDALQRDVMELTSVANGLVELTKLIGKYSEEKK